MCARWARRSGLTRRQGILIADVRFFYRNVLDWVRYLLHNIAYWDDLIYAPRCEFDPNSERIYAEVYTADWEWDFQVQRPNLLYVILADQL